MNSRVRLHAAGCLLLLGALAGCRHKAPPPPPPAAAAPPLTPSSITVITPLPSVPPQQSPNVQQAQAEPPAPAPAPAPVKRKRRSRRKPATAAPATPAPAAEQAADNTAAIAAATVPPAGAIPTPTTPTTAQAAAPALGELSEGTAISAPERVRMLADIQKQEARLAKLKQPTTSDGQAVQLQVRAFLAKARQAVAENDLDGAETLNTKARVLLDELESE